MYQHSDALHPDYKNHAHEEQDNFGRGRAVTEHYVYLYPQIHVIQLHQ